MKNHWAWLYCMCLAAFVQQSCGMPQEDAAVVELDGGVTSVESDLAARLTTLYCTNPQRAVLSDALKLGSWIAQTTYFARCVNEGYDGGTAGRITYVPHDRDSEPYDNATGISAARMNNPVWVLCANIGGENGLGENGLALGRPSTWTHEYSGLELMAIDTEFLDGIVKSTSTPFGNKPSLSGLLWHESMHQHAFHHERHGDTRASSMNEVVGNCVDQTIQRIATYRLADEGIVDTNNMRAKALNAAIAVGGIRSEANLDDAIVGAWYDRRFVARHSGKCMMPAGTTQQQWSTPGQAIVQWECPAASTERTWRVRWQMARWHAIKLAGFGNPEQFMLMNDLHGLCLDRPNGDVVSGTPLQQWGCHGGPSQRFILRNGQIEAVGVDGRPSGQCLDIPSFSQQDAVHVQMFRCKTTDTANQVFHN